MFLNEWYCHHLEFPSCTHIGMFVLSIQILVIIDEENKYKQERNNEETNIVKQW